MSKDAKQWRANYFNVSDNLIYAIVEVSRTRKDFIVRPILKRRSPTVSIYRLVMKSGFDNDRASAIQGVMKRRKGRRVRVIVHGPTLDEGHFFHS